MAAHASGTPARVLQRSKRVLVEPLSKEALTAGLESGVSQFVFRDDTDGRAGAAEWAQLGRFEALFASPGGVIMDADGEPVGQHWRVSGPADVKALEAAAAAGKLSGLVLMDAAAWKLIPAENLVALLQQQPASAQLLPLVASAAEAGAMLAALEAGTAGVVLRTGSSREVRTLCASVASAAAAGDDDRLPLSTAKVTGVTPLPGTGDRVCVDLACLMTPGEGLLVGSFASGLFLAHSECDESAYINSRPFRINAGPVHAYVHSPGGRTAYLSELRSGSEAAVVDPSGRQRAALVGRIKVEARPLVMVEAVTSDGQRLSLQLQNAETVKLVGPAPGSDVGGDSSDRTWRAISVVALAPGDEVFVLVQGGARHTGIAISEFIVEK